MSDFLAEQTRKEAAWQKAVDKLSITFEADQETGGYPDILASAGSEEARLGVLRDLGFRVLERWKMDNSLPGQPEELWSWVRVSGGISVSLADGYVIRQPGVRKR